MRNNLDNNSVIPVEDYQHNLEIVYEEVPQTTAKEKRDALPPPRKPQGSKDNVPGKSLIVQDLRQPVDELEITDASTHRL